ncbi:MAG: radical SAM protein [Roseibium sp.]|uniref:radical SAM protein n=1 Tax=Roseibium sp. TaxID=1936156 RepID=UPI0026317633|nr:radical SAM protein [Roseibium sp.]MCV0424333.1 radical SAM protein [Roseibium sp.]
MDASTSPKLDDLFTKVSSKLDSRNPAYLKVRRSPKSGDISPLGMVSEAADALTAELRNSELPAFCNWLLKSGATSSVLTLNAAALCCIRAGEWESARHLATLVNNTDHHDLVAQRLHDAAELERDDLHLPVDDWLRDKFCVAPFAQIETRANRAVHFCCSAWQPVSIGSLMEDPKEIWNSETAQEIRRSILDGDYSYCSRWHCPMISGRRLKTRNKTPVSPEISSFLAARKASGCKSPPTVAHTPDRAILSHDRSCNLSCPSCRTDVVQIKRSASAKLDDLINEKYAEFLSSTSKIKVTGSGDPFASRHFLNFLRHFTANSSRERRLQLHTNGLLLDESTWNRLDLWGHVDSVWISVDAARPETYSVVRRGGQFDRLLKNLHFLGAMRRGGAFSKLRLDFVVQKQNFREVGDFVSLAQHVGANGVYLLRLRNWGTFTPAEFAVHNVCDPDHPDFPELLAHLADQRLRSPLVELGSMQPFVRRALLERH